MFSMLPSVFGRFLFAFLHFLSSPTSDLSCIYLSIHFWHFLLPFPFIILLLHPSADHLSWEAAGWRWAYTETKLPISTTVCVEETLLTESNQPRLASGPSNILEATCVTSVPVKPGGGRQVLRPACHILGSVHVCVSCHIHQEDMLFNSQLPSPWLCGSCQMTCHHKTMAYDKRQTRLLLDDVPLLIDTNCWHATAHEHMYVYRHARPCSGIGKHVTACCIYQRD